MADYARMIGGEFLLGSHLCREPMPPMSELKADMENLKAHGFNVIKLQEHWQTDEAEEGKYDFSRYEELIEHATKLELGVYIGLTMEQAPQWLYRKYPDCRLVGHDGRTVQYEAVTTCPSDGKPGPCFDHPGARREQQKFIEALVKQLGRHENIVVWDVWQEITTNIWSSGLSDMQVCFCEHTLRFFRDWLETEHGDLDALNRAWNTRYACWADVSPERAVRQGPYAVNVSWQYFFDNVHVSRILRDRYEAIRKADPLNRPIFAHRGAPDVASPRDWRFARKVDFMASSCYPFRGAANSWDDTLDNRVDKSVPVFGPDMQGMFDEIMLRFDHIRSCNSSSKPLWAAEFQGGPKNIGLLLGNVPTPTDIRRWMLAGTAYGLTGIHFWVTRAEIMAQECNGFSLLDSEGTTTPRLEEAGHIGKFLREHADVFARQSTPQPEVGILIDEWNYKLCELMNLSGFAPREHLQYSVRGWYRMLWELNYPIDFVDIAGEPSEWVGKYKALIYPFPVLVSEKAAKKLERFVFDGGSLVCEAMPGKLDENAFCNRGELSPALRELFGVRHHRTVMLCEPGGGNRWTKTNVGWLHYDPPAEFIGTGILQGQTLSANLYAEEFTPSAATPCLLLDGRIVGTVRTVGRGVAWLLGTIVGHGGTAYGRAETRTCIARILEHGGIAPVHDGRLILRKRTASHKEAWFFINYFPRPITEKIGVDGWDSVSDVNGKKLDFCNNSIMITVAPEDIEVLILRK